MRYGLFLGTLLLLLTGCGVKAPPIAPEREGVTTPLNLNCSPSDPLCDVEDPKYVPQSR